MMQKIKRRKFRVRNFLIVCICIGLITGVGVIVKGNIFAKGSLYPNIESTVMSVENGAKIHVEIPKTNNTDIDTFLNHFAEDIIVQFKTEAGESLKDSELNIRYEYQFINHSIMTVKFDLYSYVAEAANGMSAVKTYTFNLRNGKLISLKDLFETNEDYISFLAQLRIGAKQINEQGGDEFLDDTSLENVIRSAENFSFDKDKLNVFFDKYQITPGYKGPQVVAIDMDKVHGFKWNDLKEDSKLGLNTDVVYKRILKDREDKYYEGKKLVALTFDDGPHANVTPKVLDTLTKHKVVATFFWLGKSIESNPNIALRASQEGHQVGSHTYSHFDLKRLDVEKVAEEINKTNHALLDLGIDPKGFMRPPYGSYTPKILKDNNSIGILWDVDSNDWKLESSKEISDGIIRNVKDGSIILMHDIYKKSLEALDSIISELKYQGYEFVSVEKLLELRGGFEKGEAYFYGR